MICKSVNRVLLLATFGLGLSIRPGGIAAATPAYIPPAPRKQPQVTSIGDITIRSAGLKMNVRRGTLVFTGPNVIISSRDATQPTQFRLLADEVNVKQVTVGNKEMGTVDLTGHIRYTITQKTQQGMRIIQGTAGHAAYSQATKRITLTDGVQATMTEESRLEGPATLRSSSATILTDKTQRYEIAGDPSVNDIQFTPRRKAKADNKASAPIAGTPIHIHGFRTGEIDMGRSAVLNGEETTVDFTDPIKNSKGSLTASHIAADFDTVLNHAEAKGGARFRYEGPDGKGARQSLTGHSDSATYSADQHRLTVAGNVEADFVNPTYLLEPAHLAGGQVTVHTEELRKEDARQEARVIYEISGAPTRTSLVFHPRPKEKKQDMQPAANPSGAPDANAQPKTDTLQNFAIGTAHITGFDKGTFEPGKSAVLIGDNTTYRTEDKNAHTLSLLRTSRLTAKFAQDQTLEQLEALGNVRFELQQPAAVKKPQDANQQAGVAAQGSGKPDASAMKIQTFNATATQVTLTNTTGGQILKVPGPWRTSETTDDPNKLVASSGEQGDTLTYNLSTDDLHAVSSNTPSTIVLQTVTVKKETAQAKKPAPARAAQSAKTRNR